MTRTAMAWAVSDGSTTSTVATVNISMTENMPVDSWDQAYAIPFGSRRTKVIDEYSGWYDADAVRHRSL